MPKAPPGHRFSHSLLVRFYTVGCTEPEHHIVYCDGPRITPLEAVKLCRAIPPKLPAAPDSAYFFCSDPLPPHIDGTRPIGDAGPCGPDTPLDLEEKRHLQVHYRLPSEHPFQPPQF